MEIRKPGIAALIILMSWNAFSDNALLKEQALETCKTSSLQVPEKYRDLDLKICRCIAEITDYKIVKSGDKQKIHQDWLNNSAICANENGAEVKEA